jgi:non-heme chloroperoxidase
MPHIDVTHHHSTITLHVQDYGQGKPIILIHGWPLSHQAWEGQIMPLVEAGNRVITYCRRGFGHSDKPYTGYDYDTLAADLRGIIDALSLRDITLAGFSMGGGEVARYIKNYGTASLKSIMLIASVTPYMAKADDNPHGIEPSVLEGMKQAVLQNRFALIAEWRKHFMNADEHPEIATTELLDFLQYMTYPALPKAMIECINAFGYTDFRQDLLSCDVPALIVHGTSDRICPASICAEATAKLLPHAQLELLEGAPHGLNITHKNQLNQLMIGFLNKH